MTLTVSVCQDAIKNALGGDNRIISTTELLNQTNEVFVSMYEWAFLKGGESSLDATISQDYITLPSDFDRAIAIKRNDGFLPGFAWTSKEGMAEMRAYDITPNTTFYYGVIVSDEVSDVPTWRLELHPTPTSTSSGFLILYYGRTLGFVTDDTTKIPVATYCHTLYLELLRAIAQGFHQRDTGTVSQRVAEVMVGPLFEIAKRKDHRVQPNYGEQIGGIAQASPHSDRWDNTVNDMT